MMLHVPVVVKKGPRGLFRDETRPVRVLVGVFGMARPEALFSALWRLRASVLNPFPETARDVLRVNGFAWYDGAKHGGQRKDAGEPAAATACGQFSDWSIGRISPEPTVIAVAVGILLTLGAGSIIGGLIMVWTDRGRSGYIQFGRLHVSGGALACMVLGLMVLVLAIHVLINAGTDTRTAKNTNAILNFIVPTVHAQRNGSGQMRGWVYVGPEHDYSAWVFNPAPTEPEESPAPPVPEESPALTKPEGSLTFGSLWRATGPALMRSDHVSDWSGTIFGAFISKPEVVAMIAKGDCVQILDRQEIGVRSVWAQVETKECPASERRS